MRSFLSSLSSLSSAVVVCRFPLAYEMLAIEDISEETTGGLDGHLLPVQPPFLKQKTERGGREGEEEKEKKKEREMEESTDTHTERERREDTDERKDRQKKRERRRERWLDILTERNSRLEEKKEETTLIFFHRELEREEEEEEEEIYVLPSQCSTIALYDAGRS